MTTKTSLRLITPPALPVTLAEAKQYLRVNHDIEDALIGDLIAAAVNLLDGRGGILGRALEPATWELLLDRFPAGGGEIRLPLGPVANVTSVAFTDQNGTEGTIDATDFTLDNAETFGGWIVPTAPWPATLTAINAVRVRFVAGVGAPAGVKQAILDMVAAGYQTRGGGRLLTPGIVADLAPFRRPVVA